MARVCRFFGINPAYYLIDEDEPEPDRFEQLALAEALMLRLQVWESNQQAEAVEAAKRDGHVAQSLASPGTQPRVSPPSVEEVQSMIEGR